MYLETQRFRYALQKYGFQRARRAHAGRFD
jgi:hypothetical protein